MVRTQTIHLVDQRYPELRERFDMERPYCGIVHWPDMSKGYDYIDRTTDPTKTTCKRCIRIHNTKPRITAGQSG